MTRHRLDPQVAQLMADRAPRRANESREEVRAVITAMAPLDTVAQA